MCTVCPVSMLCCARACVLLPYLTNRICSLYSLILLFVLPTYDPLYWVQINFIYANFVIHYIFFGCSTDVAELPECADRRPKAIFI